MNIHRLWKASVVFVLGLLVLFTWSLTSALAQLTTNSQIPLPGRLIPKYVDPLPHFAGARVDGTQNLIVTMKERKQVVLPSTFLDPATMSPYETTVWGYEIDDGTNKYGPLYPAYTIEAQRGISTTVEYINDLGNQTLYTPETNPLPPPSLLPGILPVDQTLHWANPLGLPINDPARFDPYTGPVPAVVHLHGGEVPPHFDGGPEAWFTPGFAQVGSAYVTNVYNYLNTQEAATLWFHDHALGVTRLNVYTGLAGFYLLRDPATLDTGIPAPGGLPAGNYEIEIVIQDRMFDTNGQLFYPNLGINIEHPFWIPEFIGDTIVVNGKTWPFLEVEPRRYRFRFLNGSNARFYQMFLENMVTATPGPVFWQIGTDGGLIDSPAMLDPNNPVTPSFLLMGPGERADIIIDFSGFAGQTLTLRNKARTPFPKGGTVDPQTTGQIMQFRVTKPLIGNDDTYNPAAPAIPLRDPLVKLANFTTGTLAPGVTPSKIRQLTLNEVMGPGGPLEVLLNNTKWGANNTENPNEGETELWQIINLTADSHPIHLHLVQFQLVSRLNFNVSKYTKAYTNAFVPPRTINDAQGPPNLYGTINADGAVGGNPAIGPYLQGTVRPAEPNEAGWKDTFIMYPGQVTTVVVRWAPTDKAITATDLWFPFVPYFENENGPVPYVWHCHILDHEDNEMMRPYTVTPRP